MGVDSSQQAYPPALGTCSGLYMTLTIYIYIYIYINIQNKSQNLSHNYKTYEEPSCKQVTELFKYLNAYIFFSIQSFSILEV